MLVSMAVNWNVISLDEITLRTVCPPCYPLISVASVELDSVIPSSEIQPIR